MAPSRGFTLFRLALLSYRCSYRHNYSTLGQTATDPTRKTQIYLSRCLDPYINLSIEHFLLQNTPPESTVLFLYTNRPCIVIGRNQNPWVEANLGLFRKRKAKLYMAAEDGVELVRRRSGGGTVFHDEGNVNYSVLCPSSVFDRDRHAQMVVRALHGLGVNNAKVNERHDIVLDAILENPHSPGIESGPDDSVEALKLLKVSGSAYKITRLRSLHHGTCLLSSPNIESISQYLRSPAKPYIKARGVGSVSSPIANVNVPNEAFEEAVVAEFGKMYGIVAPIVLSEETTEILEVAKGLTELRSLEWTYLQTPQFSFSSHKTKVDPTDKPPLPDYVYPGVSTSFTIRNGAIIQADLTLNGKDLLETQPQGSKGSLGFLGKYLHKIEDWAEVLPEPLTQENYGVSRWLNELFGGRP